MVFKGVVCLVIYISVFFKNFNSESARKTRSKSQEAYLLWKFEHRLKKRTEKCTYLVSFAKGISSCVSYRIFYWTASLSNKSTVDFIKPGGNTFPPGPLSKKILKELHAYIMRTMQFFSIFSTKYIKRKILFFSRVAYIPLIAPL